VGLLSAVLAACSPAGDDDRELGMAVAYSLASLDPHLRNTVGSYELLSSIYEPLTSLGQDLRVQPGLAVSWENPDALTWVFRLRPGVRFHDGQPLTSADVVHSFRRLLDDETLEVRSYLASVAEVSAEDEATVVVSTRWPNAQLASRLHFALIVPRGATTETLATGANGTGPYALESWSQRRGLWLRRNEDYWGERPGFSRLEVDTDVGSEDVARALTEGRYQFAAYGRRVFDHISGDERYRIVRSPSIFVRYLGMDLARETTPFCPGRPNPFRDRRVREAIDLALDRQSIVERVGEETAQIATQIVPKAVFGFDPHLPPFEHDVARARELMAEAGLGDGFEVTLHRAGAFEAAAAAVAEQLAAIGIRARVVSLPSPEFFAALDGREFSFWLSASGATTGDGLELLEASFHSPDPSLAFGVDNYGEYRNLELDAGIREAAAIFSAARRKEALQSLMRTVLEDRVWIPLYYADNQYLVDRTVDYVPRDDGYLHLPRIRPAHR
jgi:peptide/nickel transport system substrate-binding protein